MFPHEHIELKEYPDGVGASLVDGGDLGGDTGFGLNGDVVRVRVAHGYG